MAKIEVGATGRSPLPELISDAETWMGAIEKRNLASHAYNSVILGETIEFIHKKFSPIAKKLYEDLKKHL